ncbi:MAG: hypothetical protein PHU71_07065 [Candidatus Gracilibacteria bacterium]|nr:hypothetical protein [Candidatus Gracilibacteria bacterium]
MSYNAADSVLNDLLQEWVIEKKIYPQGIKDDPATMMFYNKWLKHQGIGENDYIKIKAGNTFQTEAADEGASWSTITGTPDIIKSDAITNKKLQMRQKVSGTLWRALRAKVMAGTTLKGGELTDLISDSVDAFTNSIRRISVGDGTGRMFYCHTDSNSSTTVYVTDADGTVLPASHWVWDHLYGRVSSKTGSGMHVDFVVTTTGLADAAAAKDNEIVTVTPSSGTLTMADAVDLYTNSTNGTNYDYYFGRMYTAFSDTGTSGTTALYVEPLGLEGLVTTTSALHGITNARSLSKAINASTTVLDCMMLDNLIYGLKGKAKNYMVVADPECLSRFQYEAQSMLRLAPADANAPLGFKGTVYRHPAIGQAAFIPLVELFGTKRCYVVNVDSLHTKGTQLTPEPVRGKLEWNQTTDYLFDDLVSEFENINTERNSSGYIYGLKGADTAWT